MGRRTRSRDREWAWRADHLHLLRTFAGQWVVLEGDHLIGHGLDPLPLVEAARRRGIEAPYVFFVEPDDGIATYGL